MSKLNSDVSEDVLNSRFHIRHYEGIEPATLKNNMITLVEMIVDSQSIKNKIIQCIRTVPESPEHMKDLVKAAIILDVINEVAPEHANEIVKGGHVLISDKGKLYDTLLNTGQTRERISSHYNGNTDGTHISIQGGGIFKEFLVGKTRDGKSWFQLEASPWKTIFCGSKGNSVQDNSARHNERDSILNKLKKTCWNYLPGTIKSNLTHWNSFSRKESWNNLLHARDTIHYLGRLRTRNIGQYGISVHTEINPIKINPIIIIQSPRAQLDEEKSPAHCRTRNENATRLWTEKVRHQGAGQVQSTRSPF